MRREDIERRRQNDQPEISGCTRGDTESRRAQRRRLGKKLSVYIPKGGNSGSNIIPGQRYAKQIWSGTAVFEG